MLHTRLYRRDPDIGCVLHTHSRVQTVASSAVRRPGRGPAGRLRDRKGAGRVTTHEVTIDLPVLANTQDMPAMAAEVDARSTPVRFRAI